MKIEIDFDEAVKEYSKSVNSYNRPDREDLVEWIDLLLDTAVDYSITAQIIIAVLDKQAKYTREYVLEHFAEEPGKEGAE